MSRGRALNEKRENDESDRLNADSAKEVSSEWGYAEERPQGSARRETEGMREQEMAIERRGKTSEKQRQTRRWG